MSAPAASIPFHHSVARVVAQLLIDKGWGAQSSTPGVSDDWSVYTSTEPPKPDNCITVYGTAPIIQGKSQVDGFQMEHRGITIRVRGSDEPTATVRAEALRQQLSEQAYKEIVLLDYESVEYKYRINSFPRVSLVPFGLFVPTAKTYVINLNCTVVVQTRPNP